MASQYSMAQVCAKDLATDIGLAAYELSKPCESSLFPSLANFFCEWRVIFSSLLSGIDLSDVDREHHNEEEKRIAALRKWKARNGKKATYEVLMDKLLESGERGQAESLCKFLVDLAPSTHRTGGYFRVRCRHTSNLIQCAIIIYIPRFQQ